MYKSVASGGMEIPGAEFSVFVRGSLFKGRNVVD